VSGKPGLRNGAALSTAYGAGLRGCEVAARKVGDIDSSRIVIRVEHGKGGKDRYVMLSLQLLRIFRAYWRLAMAAWLFPAVRGIGRSAPPTLQAACRTIDLGIGVALQPYPGK
jgi:integrase/recombinase XerD